MKTESHELKHITAFTIYVIDPETSKTWGAWNRYTEGQYGVGAYTNTDDEIDAETDRLQSLGYTLLGTRVRCCLNAGHFNESIVDAIIESDSSSYIQSYVN
jgi:hypothetical protein